MRLTRIEIENFKGIGTRQRIDLRPITLLFGPNSAGKSTILQTKAIRIHFRDHDTRPSAEILARDGSAQVKGLLPPGYRIEFYAWSEKLGGEDFHDRYVLSKPPGAAV